MNNKKVSLWKKIGAMSMALLVAVAIAATAAVNSGDARLDGLVIKVDGKNIVSDFSKDTYEYNVVLDKNAKMTLSAIPTASDAEVSIAVNGNQYGNHSLASLSGDKNTVVYTVKSGNATKTYTVNISKNGEIGPSPEPTPSGTSLETKYYKTNPGGKRGTNKTINMSFSNGVSSTALSNWTENELIAQGVARDVAQAMKGVHERPIHDSYALYAAYDDDYLYLGVQYVYLIWDIGGEGKQPGESKPYNADMRMMFALDLDPNKSAEGVLVNGNTIWDADGQYNTFDNGADCFLLFSAKPTTGTPGLFLPNADGLFDYNDPNSCVPFEKNSYGYQDGLLPSITSIWGQESFGFDPSVLTGETGFVDLIGEIDPSAHTFYEMKIPLKKLGITKEYIQSTGIGVMSISTFGQGAIGSLPYDPTVYDNVMENYGPDPSSSAEKSDKDVFTYAMARVGGSGVTPPTPTPTKPAVTASPASGKTFSDNVTVSLSVNPAGTAIHYSTSGTASAASPVYTAALKFSETTTLSTYVENANGSHVQTFTYTKTAAPAPEPTGDYVYLKNTSNWSNPTVWAWVSDAENCTAKGAWPGDAMTKQSDGSWMWKVPEGKSVPTKIIFSNNGSSQTSDLDYQNGKTYDSSGNIVEPVGPQKPTISVSPNGGKVKGSTTITISIDQSPTNISGSFNGKTLNLQAGSNSVSVSGYLNDGATGSLSVTATNAVGTSSYTQSFTRDDSTPVVTLTGDHRELSIYQIMVASFQHGQGGASGYSQMWGPDGHTKNGNLRGIINALEYIKSLGMNAIWMTPVFDSSNTTFSGGEKIKATGYYCSDYFNIDPKFGTKAEFKELVDKAHSLGMYVILDGVFGHHGAMGQTLTSPKGNKCWGASSLSIPNVRGDGAGNIKFPDALEYFKEVVRYWMDEYGVDGWRLDQCYQVYQNGHNYWKELREEVESVARERKNRGEQWGTLGYMVGEDWTGAGSISTTRGDGLRSVFDFDGKENLSGPMGSPNGAGLGYGVSSIEWTYGSPSARGYESNVLPNLFLTNHDGYRVGDHFDGSDRYEQLMTRHAALAAYSGPCTVYYGDEFGDQSKHTSGGAPDNISRTSGHITPNNDNERRLMEYISKAFNARAANPALWRGTCSFKKDNANDCKVLEVTKTDAETGNKVVVIFSAKDTNWSIAGSGIDLINGSSVSGSVNVKAWVPAFIKMN